MKLIDADEMIANLRAMKQHYDAISLDGMIKGLEDAPEIKVQMNETERG